MNLHTLLSDVGRLKADVGLLEAEVEVHVAKHKDLGEAEVDTGGRGGRKGGGRKRGQRTCSELK